MKLNFVNLRKRFVGKQVKIKLSHRTKEGICTAIEEFCENEIDFYVDHKLFVRCVPTRIDGDSIVHRDYVIQLDLSVKSAIERQMEYERLAKQQIDSLARILSDRIPKGCRKWAKYWNWYLSEDPDRKAEWRLPDHLRVWAKATKERGEYVVELYPEDLHAYGFSSFKDAEKNVRILASAWRKSVRIHVTYRKLGNFIKALCVLISIVGIEEEKQEK